jgi:glycosyltransferase involved in cell wall biosynthesis
MSLVSVIIPTCNRAASLERAVNSVLAQTFTNRELIVVDDGSTDSTPEILEQYNGSLLALSQQRRGVSAARNLGISHANGKLLAFLDSDDEWLPEKLARQLEFYDESDDSFICHTDEVWLRDGKVIRQKKKHAKQGGRFFERSLQLCLISPSAVLVSRDLLDRVGWFDEQLPAGEDYDLWLRVTAFHSVFFVPEPLVIKHGGHSDQLSRIIPAIDRFRIRSIVKILANSELNPRYREAAVHELDRKCKIVASGYDKRGNSDEAETYRALAAFYKGNRPGSPPGGPG